MANFEPKEKYEGMWQGKQVSFTRTFRGKRLTDAECEKLCAGKEVEVDGLVGKTGNKYGVVVALSNQEYNGRKFVGIEQLRFAEKGIPDEWCQHKFTDDEKLLLESGHRVELTGCVSKKGNTFDVAVTWEEEDGRKKIIPHFND